MASRTRAVYGKRSTVASKPAPAPRAETRVADASASPASRALSPAADAPARLARGRSVTPQRRKADESVDFPRSHSPAKRRRLLDSDAGSPASDAASPPAAASPAKPKLLSRMQPRQTASTPSPVKQDTTATAEASTARARAVTPPPNRGLGRSSSFPSPATVSPTRTLQRTATAPSGVVVTPPAEAVPVSLGSGRGSGAQLRTYGRSGATASAKAPTRVARALEYDEAGATAAVPGLGLAAKMRESYADMRKRWGVDLDEDDDAGSPADETNASPTAHALSTIVQMRTHGGSRKFADDLGYLLDGLEPSEPLGVRRTSAIEVIRKLADDAFIRTLRATGEVEPVFNALLGALLPGGDSDLVLDASIAIFLACILRDSRSASLLTRSTESSGQAIVLLARIVCAERADEPLSDANRAASKSEKRMLGSVSQVVDDAAVLANGPAAISLRSIALVALGSIAGTSDGIDDAVGRALNARSACASLASRFVAVTEAKSSAIGGRDVDAEPPLESAHLIELALILRLIDLSAIADPAAVVAPLGAVRDAFARSLVDALSRSHVASTQASSPTSPALECLIGVLRVLVTLSTVPSWGQALRLPSQDRPSDVLSTIVRIITASSGDGDAVARPGDGKRRAATRHGLADPIQLDVLCMTLCLLTNLIEADASTKDALRVTRLDSSCASSTTCSLECRCPTATSALEAIATLWSDVLAFDPSAGDEATILFLRSYLTTMLGLLMLDSPANQAVLLPKLASSPASAALLLVAVDELARTHGNDPTVAEPARALAAALGEHVDRAA